MRRDFTYIDDIVEGIIRTLDHTATPNPEWSGDRPDPATSRAPYRLYNIGNNQPVELMYLIATLEAALGKRPRRTCSPSSRGTCRRPTPTWTT